MRACITSVIIMLFSLSLMAQNGPIYSGNNVYPFTGPNLGNFRPTFVMPTSDGGFLLVGAYEFAAGDWDGRVIKTNAAGFMNWEARVGGDGADFLRSAVEVADGYVVVGEFFNIGTQKSYLLLLKYNKTNGEFIWEPVITIPSPASYFSGGYSVVETYGGGLLVGGYYGGFPVTGPVPQPPNHEGRLWVFNQNGTLNTQVGGYGSVIYKIEKSNFGGATNYYLFGEDFDGTETACATPGLFAEQPSPPASLLNKGYFSDIFVEKLNSTLGTLNTNTFGGNTADVFVDGIATPDGGFALLGRTQCFNSGNAGPNNIANSQAPTWLLKGSSTAQLQWVHTFGNILITGDVIEIPFGLVNACNNEYVIGSKFTGFFNEPGNRIRLDRIRKETAGLTTVWSSSTTPTANYYPKGNYLTKTSAERFAVVGGTNIGNIYSPVTSNYSLFRWDTDPACSTTTPGFCDKAIAVTCGTYIANESTTGETAVVSSYPGCSANSFPAKERVYRIVVSQTTDLQIGLEIITAGIDLDLFLLSNSCSTPVCIGSSTTNNSASNKEAILRNLAPGTYYIVVDGGTAGSVGNYNIDFTCGELNCATADPAVVDLACNVPYASTTNSGQNNVSIYTIPGNPGTSKVLMAGRERLHRFVLTQPQAVTITLSGATVDLGVFLLSNCDKDNAIAFSHIVGVGTETITTSLAAGTYFVAVDGHRNFSGNYTLAVNWNNCCQPPVPLFSSSVNGNIATFVNQTQSATTPVTYVWNFGNGFTSTLINPPPQTYAPGTYQVCLTATNSCGSQTYCQSVTILPAGNTLSINITDNVCGSPLQTVQVPVRVVNFDNITNLEWTFEIASLATARIVSLSFPGLPGAQFNLSGNGKTAVISWFSASPLTLPDNAIIANVGVQLTQNASGCTDLGITGSLVPTYIEGIVNGQSVEIIPAIVNGGVCVCNNTAQICGVIRREDNVPVKGVRVSLINESNQIVNTYTNTNGEYCFTSVQTAEDYRIVPQKDTNYINGVNGGDLFRIQRHLLLLENLNSPYKIIAANSRLPNSINGGDLTEIQRLILGIISNFPDVESWRFVPTTYTFPNPTTPFSPQFPEEISITNLNGSVSNANFIGMKIGDVNNSNAPANFQEGVQNRDALAESVHFWATAGTATPLDTVTVAVRTANFEQIYTGQFSMNWDTSRLAFLDVAGSNALLPVSADNFNLQQAAYGRLGVVWFGATPVTLGDASTLFTLRFLVKGEIGDSARVAFGNEPVIPYFEGTSGELTFEGQEIYVNITDAVDAGEVDAEPAFWKIVPNPTSNAFHLLNAAKNVQLQSVAIYHVDGKRLKYWDGSPVSSYFDVADLPAGTYLVRLQHDAGSQVMRLVIVR